VILAVIWFVLTRETRLDPMNVPQSLRLFFTSGSPGYWRIDPVYLPPPEAVYSSALELSDVLLGALWISLRIVLLGLAFGGLAGIATGLVLGYSPTIRRYFEATLDNLVRPVPFIACIYLFILWFRVEAVRLVVLVAIGIFLLLSLTTLAALRTVPQIYVKPALPAGPERFLDETWGLAQGALNRRLCLMYAPGPFLRHGAVPHPDEFNERAGDTDEWAPAR